MTLVRPDSHGIPRWMMATLREAAWAPILVILVYILAARVLDLFQPFPQLDIPMHLAGGMAMSFFFYRAARIGSRLGLLERRERGKDAVLVLVLTLGAALLWELGEFLSDRLYGTHEQLGLEDTITDVLVGLLGGGVMLALVASVPSRRRR
ncbi:MAG TPA: hypothetical protein VFI11_03000 [Anaerolineales bacterium]|nr:hypothetical protein [Anaerolineales bacterium]